MKMHVFNDRIVCNCSLYHNYDSTNYANAQWNLEAIRRGLECVEAKEYEQENREYEQANRRNGEKLIWSS